MKIKKSRKKDFFKERISRQQLEMYRRKSKKIVNSSRTIPIYRFVLLVEKAFPF